MIPNTFPNKSQLSTEKINSKREKPMRKCDRKNNYAINAALDTIHKPLHKIHFHNSNQRIIPDKNSKKCVST